MQNERAKRNGAPNGKDGSGAVFSAAEISAIIGVQNDVRSGCESAVRQKRLQGRPERLAAGPRIRAAVQREETARKRPINRGQNGWRLAVRRTRGGPLRKRKTNERRMEI